MTIEVSCNACLFRFRVEAQYAGKLIRCPECRLAVSVPEVTTRVAGADPGRRSQSLPTVHPSGVYSTIATPARTFRQSSEPPPRRDPTRYAQSGPEKTIFIAAVSVLGIGLLTFAAYKLGQTGAPIPQDPPVAESTVTTDSAGPPDHGSNDALGNSDGPSNETANTSRTPDPEDIPGVRTLNAPLDNAVSGNSAGPSGNSSQSNTAFDTRPPVAASPDPRGGGIFAGNAIPEARVELRLADLIEKVQPSVVRIDVNSIQGVGHGSGFVIDDSGILVTNYHVVEGATHGTVRFSSGDIVPLEGFLYLNGRKDIAILKIDPAKCAHPIAALSLATDAPRQGTAVAALGAPYGLDFTVTEGIISAVREADFLRESIGFADHDGTWIQTTAPISSGSSGGPLVDQQGNVVAINTITVVSGQNLNFGISAEDIRQGMQQISDSPTALSPSAIPVLQPVADQDSEGTLVDAVGTQRGQELMKALKTYRIVSVLRSNNISNVVTSAVDREVREVLDKAGLRESIAATATLILIMHQQQTATGIHLSMSSQLVVEQRIAGKEQLVMIWEKSDDVGSASRQALLTGTLPPTLRKEISNFFRPLRVEINSARRDAEK